MFKSSRKKLIAIGCSFTEHYLPLGRGHPKVSFMSPDIDHDFPRWPQHLADMLDMECVNLGKSGSGNDQILAKTVDATLNEKNIGLVVLMWSEWQRVGFQCFPDWDQWFHITPHADWLKDGKKYILEKQNKFHATRNTMRTFIHAEKNLSDIPYMFLQGTQAIFYNEYQSRREVSKEILTSPYFDYIESNISDRFIGWPLMSEIGGYCIDDILNKKDPTRLKYRISKTDYHPNAAGHKIIAELLYEQYKEIYNEH